MNKKFLLQFIALVMMLPCCLCTSFAEEVSRVEGGACKYSVHKFDDRYWYYGSFCINITNCTDKPITMQVNEVTPFDFVFISGGKRYKMRHKKAQFQSDRGACRAGDIWRIVPFGSISFVIDLNGDYVVIVNNRIILFRDFARKMAGKIEINARDRQLFSEDELCKEISWDGTEVDVKVAVAGAKARSR